MDNLTNSVNNSLTIAFDNCDKLVNCATLLTSRLLRIVFSVLTSLFHVGGLCLLFTIKCRKRRSTPTINMVSYTSGTLLIFLSSSEMFQGFFIAVIEVCDIIKQQAVKGIAMAIAIGPQGMGVCSIYLISKVNINYLKKMMKD